MCEGNTKREDVVESMSNRRDRVSICDPLTSNGPVSSGQRSDSVDHRKSQRRWLIYQQHTQSHSEAHKSPSGKLGASLAIVKRFAEKNNEIMQTRKQKDKEGRPLSQHSQR